jgi:hypothetical protein
VASIKIEGVPPYDGEYPLDMNMTNREFHTIKQIAGVRAGDLDDAVAHKDLDLVVALAVNALRRAGHVVDIDRLWDSEAGKIMLAADEGEDDAAPPPQPSSQPTPSGDGPVDSSGTSSSGTGGHPASDPNPTGTAGSDTTAT